MFATVISSKHCTVYARSWQTNSSEFNVRGPHEPDTSQDRVVPRPTASLGRDCEPGSLLVRSRYLLNLNSLKILSADDGLMVIQ